MRPKCSVSVIFRLHHRHAAAEAKGEAVIEPDGVADNRWREPIAWIVRDILGHPATVSVVAST